MLDLDQVDFDLPSFPAGWSAAPGEADDPAPTSPAPVEYDRDPAPGESASRRGVRIPKAGPRAAPARTRKLAAEVQLYLEMVAAGFLMRGDEPCGMAWHDNAKPVSDAIANILGRYPALAEKILGTSAVMDWVKLALALRPIVVAMYRHHGPAAGDTTADEAESFDDLYPPYQRTA